MATRKTITPDDQSPALLATDHGTQMHELALNCLETINGQVETIFAVASGGVAFAGQNKNATEAAIFRAIEDLTESTVSTRSLRECIDKLATLAGSTLVMERTRNG